MTTVREGSILRKLKAGPEVGTVIQQRGAAVGLNVKAVIQSLCDDAFNELLKEADFVEWYEEADFDDKIDETDREAFEAAVVGKDKEVLKKLMLMLDPEWADKEDE